MKGPIGAITGPRKRASRGYRSRLNRQQSPFWMTAIPVASVFIGSMITTLPFIETQAVLPPFGLMMFLAWRLMRPGLWPMWAGLPFGMFDDMFSGQPFGSAALLWSLIMLVLEIIDSRAVWRDHLQDWLIASFMIAIAILGGLFFVSLVHAPADPVTLLPQIAFSILLYPLVVRLVAKLDRWRLAT